MPASPGWRILTEGGAEAKHGVAGTEENAPRTEPGIEAAPRLTRAQYIVLGIAALAFFMEQVDTTSLNTAIPSIALDFGVVPISLNVAVTSYILALAAGIPLTGWMADRFGARRVFACAMGCFGLASLLCGLSDSLATLVLTRTLQGLAGSMMSPVGRLLVLRILPRPLLSSGLALMAIPALVGPALGPVLGGALSEYVSWRWIFFINVPVAVLGIISVIRVVPEVPSLPAGRLDLAGFLYCAAGLVAAQFTLETVGRDALPLWSQVAGGLVTLAALGAYLRHTRHRDEPLLDLMVFRRRTFRVAINAGGVARIGIQAMPFLIPLFLQLGLGMSPLRAGVWAATTSIGAISIRAVTALILSKLGFDRMLLLASSMAGVVICLFALIGHDNAAYLLPVLLIAYGLARSFHLSTNSTLGFSDMPGRLLSNANTISTVMQQLTQSFGISLAAILLSVIAGGATPGQGTFSIVFAVMGCFPLLAVLGFLRLRPQDGAVASRHPRALAALNPGRRGSERG